MLRYLEGFPGGSEGKETTCSTWLQSLGQEDLLEKGMATHSNILAQRISWTEELVGYSPWGNKELNTTKQRD